MFNPAKVCTEIDVPVALDPDRKDAQLRLLCQEDQRYLIKSYLLSGSDDFQRAAQRMQREQAGIAAFTALGVAALMPVYGPVEHLTITFGNRQEHYAQAMVFPYRTCGTLEDVIAEAGSDVAATLREAGEKIVARHRQAADLHAIHSDGAPHNIFADWMWFDFSDAHSTDDLAIAKANEVWRFICGTIAVSRSLSQDLVLTAEFCSGYGDVEILQQVHGLQKRLPFWLRILSKPASLWLFLKGDRRQLSRPRAWRALDAWLRHHNPAS